MHRGIAKKEKFSFAAKDTWNGCLFAVCMTRHQCAVVCILLSFEIRTWRRDKRSKDNNSSAHNEYIVFFASIFNAPCFTIASHMSLTWENLKKKNESGKYSRHIRASHRKISSRGLDRLFQCKPLIFAESSPPMLNPLIRRVARPPNISHISMKVMLFYLLLLLLQLLQLLIFSYVQRIANKAIDIACISISIIK